MQKCLRRPCCPIHLAHVSTVSFPYLQEVGCSCLMAQHTRLCWLPAQACCIVANLCGEQPDGRLYAGLSTTADGQLYDDQLGQVVTLKGVVLSGFETYRGLGINGDLSQGVDSISKDFRTTVYR